MDSTWRLPLGLAFSSPGVGGHVGCMGYFLATSFVALSMLVFFFAASDIAVDAVAPVHQLRFLPGVTNWELLVGRADCSCSYVWTQSSGTALSRWVLHHLLSLVTVWQMLVIWWRVYGGYLSSTWIVSGEAQARASRPPPYTTGTLCDIHIHMRARTHTCRDEDDRNTRMLGCGGQGIML